MMTVTALRFGALISLVMSAMAIPGPDWLDKGPVRGANIDGTPFIRSTVNNFGERFPDVIPKVDITVGGDIQEWAFRRNLFGNEDGSQAVHYYEGSRDAKPGDFGAVNVQEEIVDGVKIQKLTALLKTGDVVCFIKEAQVVCSQMDVNAFIDQFKLESPAYQRPTVGQALNSEAKVIEVCVIGDYSFTNLFKTSTNSWDEAKADAKTYAKLTLIMVNQIFESIRNQGLNLAVITRNVTVATEAAQSSWESPFNLGLGDSLLDVDKKGFNAAYANWINPIVSETSCDFTAVFTGKALVTGTSSFVLEGRVFGAAHGLCNPGEDASVIMTTSRSDLPFALANALARALDAQAITDPTTILKESWSFQAMYNPKDSNYGIHQEFSPSSVDRMKQSIWALIEDQKTCLAETDLTLPVTAFTSAICTLWQSNANTGYTMDAQCQAWTGVADSKAYPANALVRTVSEAVCNQRYLCTTSTPGEYKPIFSAELTACSNKGVCYQGLCVEKLSNGNDVLTGGVPGPCSSSGSI